MAYDQNIILALYKKLITLYPRGFRERLGESMEQTFNDLYQERQIKTGRFSFVFWMFIETAIGIFREYLWLISPGDIMQTIPKSIGSSALISLLFILPFIIMEVVNRRNFNEGFPIPLFIMMWILPVIFILTIMPIIRNVRAGNSLMAQLINLLLRVVVLVLVAWMWTGLLIDQMPCFLGVPNCD